jgi:hypothetical protein
MSEFTIPDCIVLKIEEQDSDTYELDHTVFILYDSMKRQYIIRGKRASLLLGKQTSPTYSFVCDEPHNLVSFLTTIISKKNLWTYTLYNYDNLSEDSNNITYEFLKEYECEQYELCGYDEAVYNKKELSNYLNILRTVYNDF